MQTDIFNFKAEREKKVQQLKGLQGIIYNLLSQFPELREIKNTNKLVRTIWARYGDYSCDSIARIARKLKVDHPELDTEDNQRDRANQECAYRDYSKDDCKMFEKYY